MSEPEPNSSSKPAGVQDPDIQVLLPESPVQSSVWNVLVVPVTVAAGAAAVVDAATEAAVVLTAASVAPLDPNVAQVLKKAVEVLKRLNWFGNLSSGSLRPPKALNSARRPTSIVAPRLASGLSHTPPAVSLRAIVSETSF